MGIAMILKTYDMVETRISEGYFQADQKMRPKITKQHLGQNYLGPFTVPVLMPAIMLQEQLVLQKSFIIIFSLVEIHKLFLKTSIHMHTGTHSQVSQLTQLM